MPEKVSSPAHVALRVDASDTLGIGHLKRCLALASALRTVGARVVFVAQELDSQTPDIVKAEGHEIWQIPTCQKTRDAAETAAALGGMNITHVVVDHYGLDASWHRALRAALAPGLTLIAAIDDLGDRDLDVDLLIDPNLAEDHRRKFGARLSGEAFLLGGPRFALLSAVYEQAPRTLISEHVNSIGIFMGGSDSLGLNPIVLNACRRVAGFAGPIEIVTTSWNRALDDLTRAVEASPGTTLSVNLPDLAAFYARHDLHIGAAGGASWERCCLGTPSLLIEIAENQRAVLPHLKKLGAIATLPPDAAPTEGEIGQAVTKLLTDTAARKHLAERSSGLVDGLGAMRAALAILANRLSVRPAHPGDSQTMFEWRNHPSTRAASRASDILDPEAHAHWLERTLADPTRLLLIGEIGVRTVGVIRFDLMDTGRMEVSLYLDPAMHGVGLGPRLLVAGEVAAHQWGGGGPLTVHATVLESNVASARMFKRAGYAASGQQLWLKTLTDVSRSSMENSR